MDRITKIIKSIIFVFGDCYPEKNGGLCSLTNSQKKEVIDTLCFRREIMTITKIKELIIFVIYPDILENKTTDNPKKQ